MLRCSRVQVAARDVFERGEPDPNREDCVMVYLELTNLARTLLKKCLETQAGVPEWSLSFCGRLS